MSKKKGGEGIGVSNEGRVEDSSRHRDTDTINLDLFYKGDTGLVVIKEV